MENKIKRVILTIGLMLFASSAMARFEMLIAGPGGTDSLTIASNETARIRFNKDFAWGNSVPSHEIFVTKGGKTVELTPSFSGPDIAELDDFVPGPATIELRGRAGAQGNLSITVEFIPDAFPPDKTVVVPAGTGFDVQLEKSTDLIFWETATPGVYDNTNGNHHIFFRIKASVLPGQ